MKVLLTFFFAATPLLLNGQTSYRSREVAAARDDLESARSAWRRAHFAFVLQYTRAITPRGEPCKNLSDLEVLLGPATEKLALLQQSYQRYFALLIGPRRVGLEKVARDLVEIEITRFIAEERLFELALNRDISGQNPITVKVFQKEIDSWEVSTKMERESAKAAETLLSSQGSSTAIQNILEQGWKDLDLVLHSKASSYDTSLSIARVFTKGCSSR